MAKPAVAHNEGLGANWKTRRVFWADRAANGSALRTNRLSLATTRARHIGNDPNVERYDTHHSIYLQDLLEFRKRRDQQRKESIERSAKKEVAQGTYDDFPLPKYGRRVRPMTADFRVVLNACSCPPPGPTPCSVAPSGECISRVGRTRF